MRLFGALGKSHLYPQSHLILTNKPFIFLPILTIPVNPISQSPSSSSSYPPQPQETRLSKLVCSKFWWIQATKVLAFAWFCLLWCPSLAQVLIFLKKTHKEIKKTRTRKKKKKNTRIQISRYTYNNTGKKKKKTRTKSQRRSRDKNSQHSILNTV